MQLSGKKYKEAVKLLEGYTGKNSHILYIREQQSQGKKLSEWDVEYVLKNYDRLKPVVINKVVKISAEYGQTLQEKYDLSFYPERILLYTVAGETDSIIHAWCKVKQNDEKFVSLFIPRRFLLDTIDENDWTKFPVDVERLNSMIAPRKLLPHQVEGIKFILHNKKCILAHGMGLGKSIQSIAASVQGEFKKILIICTASLKTNWANELSYFKIEDYSVIDGGDKQKWDLTPRYIICNYDIIDGKLHTVAYDDVWDEFSQKYVKRKSRNKAKIAAINEGNELLKCNFDMVIIDEAHSLSNASSKRTKAVKDLLKQLNCKNVVLLSGTPIRNNAQNYFSILSLIDAPITKNWNYYMTRYCGARKITLKTGKEILIPQGDTNVDELYERTKEVYLRRDKADLDLPPRTFVEKRYELPADIKAEYDKLWSEYEQAHVAEGKDAEDLNKDLVEGGIYRQFLADHMIHNTINLVDIHISNGEKVIVFCCYDNEIQLLQQHYGSKCVIYNGKMNNKQKDRAIDEFNSPDVYVFIGNINAAGTGINLTNSHITVFNSFTWVPSDIQQASDRNYRLGQTHPVTTYIQLFADTHNEYVYNKVLKKELTINTIIKNEKEK